MIDLYNSIIDNIPLSNDLHFLYPIIFLVLLVVGLMFVFLIFDRIFYIFRR